MFEVAETPILGTLGTRRPRTDRGNRHEADVADDPRDLASPLLARSRRRSYGLARTQANNVSQYLCPADLVRVER